ncbi:hypothetical protein PT093_00770 [Erysipelothrix rhusiopathiae]|nr:hypothetical protein [Erysipelothrix rhusiopathiae]
MEVYLLIGIIISLLLLKVWKNIMCKNYFINLVGFEFGENTIIQGTTVIKGKNYGNNVVGSTTLERK